MPITRPSRIDSRAKAGGANRSINKMMIKVAAAKARLIGAPKSSEATPPPAQPAATGISDNPMIKMTVPVTSGGKNELEDYLGFLKGGCSKYPLDLLRDAGVDMETPEPVNAAMGRFEQLVGELEELV